MKKILTFLPMLLLLGPAFADGFGPNDKVLYFNSDVLIDVIKRNVADDLQLNVAQKYVDLMDANGNVSVADLVTVCGTGNLDTTKCRDFINDLLKTANADIKPFYWADYVSYGFGGDLNTYNSGDGYFHFNDALENGDWAIRFPWMKYKTDSYQKLYPGYNYLRGTSACTNDAGTRYGATDAGYAPNQQSGQHCWCRMTEPEASPWIYYGDKTSGIGGTCERSCALGCMTQLRDETQMRSAMFNAVKLNGSNANTKPDPTLAKNLTNRLRPCEFDWAGVHHWLFDDDKYGYKSNIVEAQPYIDFWTSNNPRLEWGLSDHNPHGLNDSEWFARNQDFMKDEDFQCKYPNVTKINGVSTCNSEKGTYGKATNKSFKSNEVSGSNCWCKMTYPEQSKWVYFEDMAFTGQEWGSIVFYTNGTQEVLESYIKKDPMLDKSACAAKCPSLCFSLIREICDSIGKK